MKHLERFISWSNDILQRAETGEERAETIVAFFNWTLICIMVAVASRLLIWWLA
jgi:hypothetical protein